MRYLQAVLSIDYYDDLHFIGAQETPDCLALIDRDFGSTIALNLLWRGRIHFAVDGATTAELTGPTAYWTWGGPRFLYGNVPGHGWHQLWVLAGGARAQRMVDGGLVPRGTQPWGTPEDPEEFLFGFRRLITLVARGRKDEQPERVQLLERLFREAVGRVARADDSPQRCISLLAERIAAEPTREYDFALAARGMGLSYHHFRRLFADQAGRAPQAYLLDCRMRWAAGRLAAGAESVKSVAFEVGFTDPRAFARQFRNRTAMAPHTLLATRGKRSSPGMVV